MFISSVFNFLGPRANIFDATNSRYFANSKSVIRLKNSLKSNKMVVGLVIIVYRSVRLNYVNSLIISYLIS